MSLLTASRKVGACGRASQLRGIPSKACSGQTSQGARRRSLALGTSLAPGEERRAAVRLNRIAAWEAFPVVAPLIDKFELAHSVVQRIFLGFIGQQCDKADVNVVRAA